MNNPTPARKGARKWSDVSPELLRELNAGRAEALTLSELLVVDFRQLFGNVVSDAKSHHLDRLDPAIGIAQRMRLAGELLVELFGNDAHGRYRAHPSDLVRGWAAYALAKTPKLKLAARLKKVRPLANDNNPGVREWAWISLRPHVAEDLESAVELLCDWSADKAANIRRYASEITRPRGVWCEHIALLKSEPERCLPILEPLKNDETKYVQDSVANWLNDASKSRPDWVRKLCARWRKESKTKATERIVTRALRTIGQS
jgi:3-methyladenine DNA glycosylase AlkC